MPFLSRTRETVGKLIDFGEGQFDFFLPATDLPSALETLAARIRGFEMIHPELRIDTAKLSFGLTEWRIPGAEGVTQRYTLMALTGLIETNPR